MGKSSENDWKKRLGVVYSTNADFVYQEDGGEVEAETLPPQRQLLRLSLDKKARAGKKVTLIAGFVGSFDDLSSLAKSLKVKLGIGGTAKDGEITLQGDFREKAATYLQSIGYKVKVI